MRIWNSMKRAGLALALTGMIAGSVTGCESKEGKEAEEAAVQAGKAIANAAEKAGAAVAVAGAEAAEKAGEVAGAAAEAAKEGAAATVKAVKEVKDEVVAKIEKEATIGKAAPDFTLMDTDGKSVTLSSFKGKTVVVEWFNPDCPFVVQQHTRGSLTDQAKRVASDTVIWLAINSGAPGKQGADLARNIASKTEYGLTHTVLLDTKSRVGRLYGAKTTPHMFVVDKAGVLVYAGAIDNAPMGMVPADGLVNYIDMALANLAAGEAVKVAQTKPYGCSVKYP